MSHLFRVFRQFFHRLRFHQSVSMKIQFTFRRHNSNDEIFCIQFFGHARHTANNMIPFGKQHNVHGMHSSQCVRIVSWRWNDDEDQHIHTLTHTHTQTQRDARIVKKPTTCSSRRGSGGSPIDVVYVCVFMCVCVCL